MDSPYVLLSAAAFAAWIYLAFFRHDFWRADQLLPPPSERVDWPSVAAIVPARNEEETIGACVASLAAQDYPGPFVIHVVDDQSSDRTADEARKAANGHGGRISVEVIQAPPIESGWAGKLWAVDHGIRNACRGTQKPDYLWLTDADIVHGPGVLRALVDKADRNRLGLDSLMVRLACRSFWERLLVPAFIYFFQMLYPFPAINDRANRIAGAAGGCALVTREALEAVGGIATIRSQLIDDCALAMTIKRSGWPVWVGLAQESHSLRGYETLISFWRMVTRSAFVQLRYSNLLLVFTLVGMSITFLVAPVIVITFPLHGHWLATVLAAGAWALQAHTYRPTLELYGLSPFRSLTLPAAALLFMLMTLHSAVDHWRGRGQSWKGRRYAEFFSR